MKRLGIIGLLSFLGCLGAVPAAGHNCGHRGHHGSGCRDCDSTRNDGPAARRSLSSRASAPQSLEGTVAEVIYLNGPASDSGMVEIRLESGGQATLVRLAPAGVLRKSGLVLKEGDAIAVKGFPIAGMESDLTVATEVRKGQKAVSLRDSRGRPTW